MSAISVLQTHTLESCMFRSSSSLRSNLKVDVAPDLFGNLPIRAYASVLSVSSEPVERQEDGGAKPDGCAVGFQSTGSDRKAEGRRNLL